MIFNKVLYAHFRKDSDEIFYVGIGSSKRPFVKSGRSKYWQNIVNKHGYYVKILQENLSQEEACILEEKMIALYGRKDLGLGPLVNTTDGGEGIKSLTHSKEAKRKMSKNRANKCKGENNPKFDSRIFKFKNKSTGAVEECTRYELQHKYDLSHNSLKCLIQGKYKTAGNWLCLNPEKEFVSKRKPKKLKSKRKPYSTEIVMKFIHENGVVEICNQLELQQKHNIDRGIRKIVIGTREKYKGWTCHPLN